MASHCGNISNDNVDGHVHFAANVEPHNIIQVKQDEENNIQVHVGFLKTNHKYEIKFAIPNLIGNENILVTEKAMKNVDMIVNQVMASDSADNMLDIVVQLTINQEGLMKICFNLHTENKACDVILHVRVLGKYSGTPLVKDGIHCIEVIKDDNDSSNELT